MTQCHTKERERDGITCLETLRASSFTVLVASTYTQQTHRDSNTYTHTQAINELGLGDQRALDTLVLDAI